MTPARALTRTTRPRRGAVYCVAVVAVALLVASVFADARGYAHRRESLTSMADDMTVTAENVDGGNAPADAVDLASTEWMNEIAIDEGGHIGDMAPPPPPHSRHHRHPGHRRHHSGPCPSPPPSPNNESVDSESGEVPPHHCHHLHRGRHHHDKPCPPPPQPPHNDSDASDSSVMPPPPPCPPHHGHHHDHHGHHRRQHNEADEATDNGTRESLATVVERHLRLGERDAQTCGSGDVSCEQRGERKSRRSERMVSDEVMKKLREMERTRQQSERRKRRFLKFQRRENA